MNFLKYGILHLFGFINMYRLAAAMRAGGDRPLKDVPYWLIGWFSMEGPSDTAPAISIACRTECIREIRQRRREAELAGHHASIEGKNP